MREFFIKFCGRNRGLFRNYFDASTLYTRVFVVDNSVRRENVPKSIVHIYSQITILGFTAVCLERLFLSYFRLTLSLRSGFNSRNCLKSTVQNTEEFLYSEDVNFFWTQLHLIGKVSCLLVVFSVPFTFLRFCSDLTINFSA